MSEFFFSRSLDGGGTLCIAPLTDRLIAQSGQEIADSSGYFLFEKTGSDDFTDTQIIAHVLSEEAALQLKEMFKMT